MDKADVIRMAREAGAILIDGTSAQPYYALYADELERFASLVAAAKQEECARVALDHECGGEDDFICQHLNCGLCISAAIRALK